MADNEADQLQGSSDTPVDTGTDAAPNDDNTNPDTGEQLAGDPAPQDGTEQPEDNTDEIIRKIVASYRGSQQPATPAGGQPNTPPQNQQPKPGEKPGPSSFTLDDDALEALAEDLGTSAKSAKSVMEKVDALVNARIAEKLGPVLEGVDDFKHMRGDFRKAQEAKVAEAKKQVQSFFDTADDQLKGVFGKGTNRTPAQIEACKTVFNMAMAFQASSPDISDADALKAALKIYRSELPGAAEQGKKAESRSRQITQPPNQRAAGSGGASPEQRAVVGIRKFVEARGRR